ncbi:MAG TPA: riboflavin synthase [Bacteroidia bacterium]|nr:riboflavin synthase [Bacteroidia bacterium]
MFTGIIEASAKVENIQASGSNIEFTFSSPITSELKVDQSLAHNGVCLTVTGIQSGLYKVTAIEETLQRSNLGALMPGDTVNLERCMPSNGRFDGHIVQGHVDTTALCTSIKDLNGSWKFDFEYPAETGFFTVDKGSITVNGVSLTVVDALKNRFSVCIIPYTYQHTNFGSLKTGDRVNLEFDVIGKYVARLMEIHKGL